MRNILIIMFLTVFQVFADDSYSQNTRLTLNLNNVTIEDVLNQIENQSEFYFLCNKKLVDIDRKINIHMEEKDIEEILAQLFDGTDIDYIVIDRQIVLSPDEYLAKVKTKLLPISINGIVTDENGEPLPGVSISIKGTTKGTITNLDGEYTIEVNDPSVVMVFSYVGYITQEITAGDNTVINIAMEVDVLGLEEVVVIGYGTIKKSDLIGAVASVKADDLTKTASPSILSLLKGKAAGLQILQTSAQPGGGLALQIRGSASVAAGNNPLIVVDGFPLTEYTEPGTGNRYVSGLKESTLSMINPNDVESIEVLKDASATAIYGARAANGVILITTKRGRTGTKRIEYNGSFSTQKYTGKPEYFTDMSEFMTVVNESYYEHYLWDNQLPPFGNTDPSSVMPFVPKYSDTEIANAGEGTDWLEEILRTGQIQQHNISITNASETTKYLMSFNYFNHKGILLDNDIKRTSVRFNLDQTINDFITVGFSANASQKKDNNTQLGSSGNEFAGVITSVHHYLPTIPVKDADGNYSIGHPLIPNPVSYKEIDDFTSVNKVLITSYVELSPIKGLRLRMNLGADINRGKHNTYLPRTFLYGAQEGGKASITENEKDDYLFDLTANYSTTINEIHNLSALAGYSYQEFNWEGFSAGNKKFLTDGFKWYDLSGGEAEKPDVGSYGGKDLMVSYFGRINYSLLDRYLLTATIRADGASNFSKDNKWGYFPSVALGWRLSEESFMSGIRDQISNLKLRASYGQTGNSGIGHRAFASYSTGANFLFGTGVSTGVYASQLENPKLKWETTTEINLGLDFGFFNNRISGSVEYYNLVVSDLLAIKNLMSFHEVSTIAANMGKTRSKGVELYLAGLVINRPDFLWKTEFNYMTYKDTWEERDPQWKPAVYENEKDPIRIVTTYLADGIVQIGEQVPHMPGIPPGCVILKDINGYLRDEYGNPVTDENGRFQLTGEPDGKLDDADIVNLGTADPGFSMSLNNSLNYKNFDLNIYFYGFFDRLQYHPFVQEANWSDLRWNNNANPRIKDRWTINNQNSKIAGALATAYSGYGLGDIGLKKTWFIRCNNVTLGYTLPKKITSRFITNARFYVEGQNLLLFTNYEGVDPETDGQDNYPNQRTFSIGVNLSF